MQKCSFLRHLIPKTDYVSPNAIRRFSSSVQRFSQSEPETEKLGHTPSDKLSRRDYRYIFPEFLPDPNPEFRNALAERLQRKDLLARRSHVEIPGILPRMKNVLCINYFLFSRILCWESDGSDCF